tara:strand:- start:279 stop:1277 length:999 start_codon:yes stop_codon:yes gene_type:complete
MASTYTTNLRLTKQGDGDNPNSWGQVLNDGVISLADQAIAGYTEVSIGSAATVNLTANDGADDQSRNAFLKITGSIGTAATSIFLVIPNKSKSYSVLNAVSANADSNVVMMRVAGNTGVTIGRSTTTFQHVVCDGASVRSANLLPNNVCVADNLFVGNNLKVEGVVTVSGAATFKNDVSVSGNLAVGGTFITAGAARFDSTVTVSGAQVNKTTTRFEGAVSLASGAPVHQIITTIADAASIVMNMATNNQFLVTLGGDRTLAAPTNLTTGQTGHIYCIQNSGGGHTLGYNSVFQFAGGSDPVLTAAGGSVDLLVFSVRASDKVDAVMVNDLK